MCQERDVFLNRALIELVQLSESRYGLTVSELANKLVDQDSSYDFSLRTIRRDCQALERAGWIEKIQAPGQALRYRKVARLLESGPSTLQSTCERSAILDRIGREARALRGAEGGLSIREMTALLNQGKTGHQRGFTERTVRRDCLTLEYHGFLEHVFEERNQKFKPSRRMRDCLKSSSD